jgi:hypothetical protein
MGGVCKLKVLGMGEGGGEAACQARAGALRKSLWEGLHSGQGEASNSWGHQEEGKAALNPTMVLLNPAVSLYPWLL